MACKNYPFYFCQSTVKYRTSKSRHRLETKDEHLARNIDAGIFVFQKLMSNMKAFLQWCFPLCKALISTWDDVSAINQDCVQRHDVVFLWRKTSTERSNKTPERPLHWGPDEMDNISQITFSKVFPSMEMFEFRYKLHWNLLIMVQLSIFQHCLR